MVEVISARYPLRWSLLVQVIREVEHLCLHWIVVLRLSGKIPTGNISRLAIIIIFRWVDESYSVLIAILILPILCLDS